MTTIFVREERQAWMRLESHTVVFDRDPEFEHYRHDESGSVITTVRIWVAESGEPVVLRHFLGSVRHCECGGWMSGPELRRLFRQATVTAESLGEEAQHFRARLSEFLRASFKSA